MKDLSIKLVGLCLVFFASMTIANAQAVQAAEPPSNPDQSWDDIHQAEDQAKLAAHNSLDAPKLQAYIAATTPHSPAQCDTDAEAALAAADLAGSCDHQVQAAETAAEMAANGYLAIPGFTMTGDNSVDQFAYEAAVQALVNDAAALDAWVNDNPGLVDQLPK